MKLRPITSYTDQPALDEILAAAMRHAREGRGYSIRKIDRAVAMALLVESAQRVAMATDAPLDEMPEHGAVAEIFEVVIEDIRREALRILAIRQH